MYISYTVIHSVFSLYNACFVTISSQKLPLVFTLMWALFFIPAIGCCTKNLGEGIDSTSVFEVATSLGRADVGDRLCLLGRCTFVSQQMRFIHP